MNSVAPIPRPGVYELYWKFAYERQKAFEARVAGQPGPWTNDPIIARYKFCNVYRAADRVSQYMIRDVCYNDQPDAPSDRLFQIVAFRIFSNIATWESLRHKLGHSPIIDDLVDGSFERALCETKAENRTLYTGAFILCATNAYGRRLKHLNHVELLKDMFVNRDLGRQILEATSLRYIYDLVHGFPLMGDFMSYQIAIDLNYSDLVNFSENDFTVTGPGALRGMEKLFTCLGDFTPAETVMWMVERQDEEFQRLGLAFNGLWGRKLQAIDAQGLFCETDKYCRVKLPELRSNRSKIKSRYAATGRSTEEIFLPPKWGLKIPIASQTSR